MTASPGPSLDVLYRDEWLVAVAKPGGLLVHRTPEARDRRFLLQELRDQLGEYLYPVHRLDRATSGVIVFGFSSEDARALHDTLRRPETSKEYWALVRGSTPDRFESRRPLQSPQGEPRPAWSEFEKLSEFSRCSLLGARIHTGRRHQIRRHLHHLKHQVIGDTSYGKGRINAFFREEYGLPRLFLHAHRLTFEHPHTGKSTTIEAPLAEDLRAFLGRLPDADLRFV